MEGLAETGLLDGGLADSGFSALGEGGSDFYCSD